MLQHDFYHFGAKGWIAFVQLKGAAQFGDPVLITTLCAQVLALCKQRLGLFDTFVFLVRQLFQVQQFGVFGEFR